jgi:hypothetical protein
MHRPHLLLCAVLLLGRCTGSGGQGPAQAGPTTGTYKEGIDYIVLERVRFMDEQGFERPAEAFSVLLPKGWKHEGGIHWKGLDACRGEMVTASWSASSPDGSIHFVSLPLSTWGSASDPMMRQSMMTQAQNGGCGYGGPLDAEHYLREVLVPQELHGASIIEVKENEAVRQEMDRQAQRQRTAMEQYGGTVDIRNSAVSARLKWGDGTEGIAITSVMNGTTTMQNTYSGAMQQFTTSVATERSYMRYPAVRKEEAERVWASMESSYRTNPAWKQAIDGYMADMGGRQDMIHRQRLAAIDARTRTNTAAHQQRMADIQAWGAANTAAHGQRMTDMDDRMRSWENQQASLDRQHTDFVQTIREVETWKDASGSPVEMSAGYEQAWSHGDGDYILSNKPGFDPSSVFQDQNWTEMQRAR